MSSVSMRRSGGIVSAFHEAVDDYVATCAKIDKAPEKSYSGKVLLRLDPDSHAGTVAMCALGAAAQAFFLPHPRHMHDLTKWELFA